MGFGVTEDRSFLFLHLSFFSNLSPGCLVLGPNVRRPHLRDLD